MYATKLFQISLNTDSWWPAPSLAFQKKNIHLEDIENRHYSSALMWSHRPAIISFYFVNNYVIHGKNVNTNKSFEIIAFFSPSRQPITKRLPHAGFQNPCYITQLFGIENRDVSTLLMWSCMTEMACFYLQAMYNHRTSSTKKFSSHCLFPVDSQ